MDCSPPGSSVHGILQARMLEWVVIPFSRESSQTRDQTQVSHIVDRCFIVEIYITTCKVESQWEFVVWLKGLKQGLCINLEGWGGEGDRRKFQRGEDICIPMADSCWCLQKPTKLWLSNYPSIKNKFKKSQLLGQSTIMTKDEILYYEMNILLTTSKKVLCGRI